MECPACNTINDDQNDFCMNCGQALLKSAPSGYQAVQPQNEARQLLGIYTIRIVIALFVVWFVKAILLWLPFTKNIQIPDIPITINAIITSLAWIIVLFLLISYVQTFASLWPRAFPKAAQLSGVLISLILLGILLAIYYAFLPLIIIADTGGDVRILFQVILAVVALIILVRAGMILYQYLPQWLSSIQFVGVTSISNEVACLNCGRINSLDSQYCKRCGVSLGQAEAEE